MDLTSRRATRALPLLAALTLLAGCTTTVAGTGRAGGPPPSASGSGSGSSSHSGSGAGATPLQIWQDVHDAIVALPNVTVNGSFAGAGLPLDTDANGDGDATITGGFGTVDGDPVALVTVLSGGERLEVRAVGGSAWVRAAASFYTKYGYDAAVAAKAANLWVRSTDDDKGLDVFASLDAFLQICAPDDDTDDLTAAPTADGFELASQTEDGSVQVTTDPPQLVTSQFSGDDLEFGYGSTPLQVDAPDPGTVVELPDF